MDPDCAQAPEKDIETLTEGIQSMVCQLKQESYLSQYKVSTGKISSSLEQGGNKIGPENEVA